jgi:hypothetical protein
MNEYLTFDPSTEFKLIGNAFEMNESVQRDASVRFYTLDEQIADAFEKMIPATQPTKFELNKLVERTERIRELYQTYVSPTADGYVVRTPEVRRLFPWVLPVYPDSERVPTSVLAALGPLLTKEARTYANGYERILLQLPHPYAATGDGVVYPQTRATEFVNVDGKEPRRALPPYDLTQTRQHENGNVVIATRSLEGTADTIKCIGYYLTERANAIPNPFPDHPFFADKSGRFYPSSQPASEIIPDIKTVLEHGVPITPDPYGEGMKFLRVYDVALSDIPWSSWTSRFPSVQHIDAPPPREPIENMIKTAQYKPDEKLTTEYGTDYAPGLAARHWLMSQVDGGGLVIAMLRSNAASSGVMQLQRVLDPIQSLQPIPLDKCELNTLTFHDFLLQGTTRQHDVMRNGKWIGNEYKCIPLDIVLQERKQVGHRDRIPWKDSTQTDILTSYRQALAQHKRPVSRTKSFTGSKIPVRNASQTRLKAVAILDDVSRLDVDKKTALDKLFELSKALHSGQTWTDSDGLFVLCDHTLSILRGDLARDSDQFYRVWTTTLEGGRTCKSCGEVIDKTVLVDQVGYTDEGRVSLHADVLDGPNFSGHKIATIVSSLRALSVSFDMKDPADSTLFLILSLLQVLPEESQLVPILQLGRELSTTLGKKGNSDAIQSARGVVGLASAIVLLQSHLPQLVPRRSFGSRPLILSGYPRDTDTATEFPILDSIFTVIRKTFQAYPTALQGPSVQVMRSVLNDQKDVKAKVLALLKRFVPTFKDQLKTARIEIEKLPPVPEPVRLLTQILPPPPGRPVRFPECPSTRLSWISTKAPVLGHQGASMRGITGYPYAKALQRAQFTVLTGVQIPPAEIRALIVLKPNKTMVITSSWSTNLVILKRIASAIRRLDLAPLLDTTQYSESILNDLTEGLLKKLYSEIEKSTDLTRIYESILQSDSTLFASMKKVDDARKEANKLRAQERHAFTDILRNQTDQDRQITKELLDLGLAPFLITNADRDRFAQQLEDELRPDMTELNEVEPDVGVGQTRAGDNEEEDLPDDGNYGTNAAFINREQENVYEPVDTDGPI